MTFQFRKAKYSWLMIDGQQWTKFLQKLLVHGFARKYSACENLMFYSARYTHCKILRRMPQKHVLGSHETHENEMSVSETLTFSVSLFRPCILRSNPFLSLCNIGDMPRGHEVLFQKGSYHIITNYSILYLLFTQV